MPLAPGEQPRSAQPSPRRIAIALTIVAIIAIGWMSQRRQIDEYRLFLTEDRRPAAFAFSELDERWTEDRVRERFAGFPVRCTAFQGDLATDRASWVDVKSHNAVPALFLAFFFSHGQLVKASVNVPWWSHRKAYRALIETLGPPTGYQAVAHEGVRLIGWQLPDGAAVFYNRDRPLNPLSWNAVVWMASIRCGGGRCFRRAGDAG